jgi:hypothetical protein
MKSCKKMFLLMCCFLTLILAGCKPVVTIIEPVNGDKFAVGEKITFKGEATDPQHPNLADNAFVWTSDKDGEIGTGPSFESFDLSEGRHTITLTVTDPDGQVGQSSVTITVGNNNVTTSTTASTTSTTTIPVVTLCNAENEWINSPFEPLECEVEFTNGIAISIVPSAYPKLGEYRGLDNLNCLKAVTSYLGIDFYYSYLIHRDVISKDNQGSSAGYLFSDEYGNQAIGILTEGPETMFNDFYSQIDKWLEDTSKNITRNVHEVTHTVINGLALPGYINEGLATYLEDTNRTNYIYPMSNHIIECNEDNMIVAPYDPSNPCGGLEDYHCIQIGYNIQVDYLNLTNIDPNVPGTFYYKTGACFWDWIETEYGHDTLVNIMKRLDELRVNPETYFVKDVLNVVVGQDLSGITEKRFGIGLESK